jgi:hypothetical protein
MLKRLVILALLLFVFCVQTYTQTDKTHDGAKHTEPSSPVAFVVPQQDNSNGLQPKAQANINADVRVIQTPAKDRYDKAAFWVNFSLAGIGLCGVLAAVRTLRKIKIQADEMRLQRIAMEKTLQTINRQADLMERQAADARGAAAEATQLARQSAEAASLNAFTLVNSERAWVQVEVIGDPRWVKTAEGSSMLWFRPLLKNFGRTPATVEFMVVRPHLLPRDENFPEPPQLPLEPDYVSLQSALTDRQGFVPPMMGINPLAIGITDADFELMKKRERFLYIYGQIFYRDISGEERESRFCNLYWIPPDDSHPIPEGFMTTGNTPNAYTQCN